MQLKPITAIIVGVLVVASISIYVVYTGYTNNNNKQTNASPSYYFDLDYNLKHSSACWNPYFSAFVVKAFSKCPSLHDAGYNTSKRLNVTHVNNDTWRYSGDYIVIDCDTVNPPNASETPNSCGAAVSTGHLEGLQDISPNYSDTLNTTNYSKFPITVFYLVAETFSGPTYYPTSSESADRATVSTTSYYVFMFQNPDLKFVGVYEVSGLLPSAVVGSGPHETSGDWVGWVRSHHTA